MYLDKDRDKKTNIIVIDKKKTFYTYRTGVSVGTLYLFYSADGVQIRLRTWGEIRKIVLEASFYESLHRNIAMFFLRTSSGHFCTWKTLP